MDFRLFYSSNTTTYTDTNNIGSTPALAAAPSIAMVSSQVGEGEVTFGIHVVGNPAAGIQETWVTWAISDSNSLEGSWQSIDLVQNESDSTLWEGTLVLPTGVAADQIRYIVQAVNGVGLVSMSNNQGYYFVPGAEVGPSTHELAFFGSVPATGRYSSGYAQRRLTATVSRCRAGSETVRGPQAAE
jgi:hypothetical protein